MKFDLVLMKGDQEWSRTTIEIPKSCMVGDAASDLFHRYRIKNPDQEVFNYLTIRFVSQGAV